MLHTAAEIVALAGIEADVIGKVRVNIGGIPVNRPDHLINVQDAKTVTLIVGLDEVEVTLPEEGAPSEAVTAVKEAHGRVLTEKAAELAEAKLAAEAQ